MTGLACEMGSSSGKAVISGPLVAENDRKVQGNLIMELIYFVAELSFANLSFIV